MKKTITIEGMSCGHCVGHVKKALEAVSGVASVEVNLSEKQAWVEVSSEVKDDVLKDVIEDAGYDVVSIV